MMILLCLNILLTILYLQKKRSCRPSCNLAKMLDGINQAVFSCNISGSIISHNKAAKDWFGIKVGERVPKILFDEEIIQSIVKSRLNEEDPVEIFKIDLSDKKYLIRMELSSDSQPIISVAVKDITDNEKARSYQEMYRQQSGLVLLGAIFENLAHEIRTPCLSAEGCFQMIEEDILTKLRAGEALDAEDIDLLTKYCHNGARTTSQIADLLNRSRSFRRGCRQIEVGDIELREACLYCQEAIEASYRTIIGGKIQLISDDSLCYIVKGQLNRVLESLGSMLKNSVEAIVEQSRIEQDLEPSIIIKLKKDPVEENPDMDEVITLEILDNGCGIREDLKKRIGNSLFTTKSHDLQSKGTGLGLAMTIQTINSMGGTWEIDNRTDGITGSRTVIKIPLPQIIS